MVVLQGVAAWNDGFFTQRQLHKRGVLDGESFLSHGGMWADIIIISPLVTYILVDHKIILNTSSLLLFSFSIFVSGVLGYVYYIKGVTIPHPHAHDGKTTLAGWIHNVFTVSALFVLLLPYTGFISPLFTASEFLWMAIALTVFFVFGIVKFDTHWRVQKFEVVQVVAEIFVLWLITLYIIL